MTSKSLEALEELKDEIIPDYALHLTDDGYIDWVKELYNTIKQDLERLQEYDETLKTRCGNCYYRDGKSCTITKSPLSIETLIKCIETDRIRATNAFHKVLEEKEQLEKENQELKRYKEKAILYDKACNKDKSANKIIVDLDYLENLQNEERKFGFAIEILTRVANIKTEKHLTRLYEHKYISKEDYELLKEVLG